jgi:hypothetical protein
MFVRIYSPDQPALREEVSSCPIPNRPTRFPSQLRPPSASEPHHGEPAAEGYLQDYRS